MTLVADIPARRAPAHGAEPPDRDRHIARAQAWVCMLDGLSRIGTRFGEYLTQKATPEKRVPKGPMMVCRLIGDPILASVRVMRAVCLAISLAAKIQDDIAGLKAGILPSWASPSPKAPCSSETTPPETTLMGELAGAVAEATPLGGKDQEADLEVLETPERAEALSGELRERLRDEREDARFHRLLNGPLKDAVAAICADLGLKPDWSLWTEDGFPPPSGGGIEDWMAFFVPEGDVESTSFPEGREPARPPPRRDGPRGWDKDWRPPWPPPEPRDPSPPPDPVAARSHDGAARPDDSIGRSRRATLLGTTIIAGAPGAARRAIARLGDGSGAMPAPICARAKPR